jgi:hypothetical protein
LAEVGLGVLATAGLKQTSSAAIGPFDISPKLWLELAPYVAPCDLRVWAEIRVFAKQRCHH